MSKSKWDILVERMEIKDREVKEMQKELAHLATKRCGMTCSGCGEFLAFESDFAKHFLVKDYDIKANFLNLGYCPNNVQSNLHDFMGKDFG